MTDPWVQKIVDTEIANNPSISYLMRKYKITHECAKSIMKEIGTK